MCLLIGLGALAMSAATSSDEVTCSDRVMQPGDTCVHIDGGSSTNYSYDEEKAYSQRLSHGATVIGWIFLGIGAVGLLFVLATARSGSGRGRGISHEQLTLLAADRSALATQQGWEYRENEPRALVDARTGPLVQGQQRQAKHVLIGKAEGHTFAIFDYLRRPTDGPQKGALIGTTVWQVYLPTAQPTIEVWDRPPYDIRKQFEPFDPAEPKGYVVRSSGADAARQLLTPQVMSTIQASGLNTLLIDGKTIIAFRDAFYSAGKAEALLVSDLQVLVAVAAALPASAAQQ
jgi:hypothetical protein